MVRRILLLIFVLSYLGQSSALRAQQSATNDLIKTLQSRVRRYPEDYAGYAGLGAAYLQKGRETGDAADFELAKGALEKSLDLLSNDPAAAFAMTQMAVVCMAEHRFDDALAWAQKALAPGSGDPSPWAIAGDALADMGDYAGAAEAYSKLDSVFGSEDEKLAFSYQRDTRTSFLRFIAGDTAGATDLMRSAIQKAIEMRMPAENIAWSEYQLGEELFQTGEMAPAEKAYLAALQEYPGYYRGLAGLAKVRAAQGRYTDAVDLFKKTIAAVPYPEYAAALGDVYQKLGNAQEAKKQYELVEFIGYLSQINQQIHNRDLALFYADHDLKLNESLELARKELEVRHDIYSWDVLAWSLYKNGKFQDAADAISHALSQGTKDAQLFFHAGMIYETVGDSAKAKSYLRQALATNPRFNILNAEKAAETLARLTQKDVVDSSQEASGAR
jgi:tetratricopeptide (TPR) repeat protein